MKIAMIGLRGIPSRLGGIETAVQELSVRLARRGHEVTVYCRSHYHREHRESYEGVRLVYLPSINTKHLESITHTSLSLCHALFRQYDIIHLHALGPSLFAPFFRIFGKKVAATIQGLDWQRAKWRQPAVWALKVGEYCSARFPHRTIVVSRKLERHYRRRYGIDPVYIPNGVNSSPRAALNRLAERFGLESERYLLFLSRIVPEKGCHYLIEAFRQIETDMKLLIAGDTTHTRDYERQLREMARGDGRIIFAGPLFDEDKAEAMSNAFLYVHPSEIEGLPIALLEAMSHGRNVLVSDIEENLEAIENGAQRMGESFRNKSVSDLKDRLQELIRHPERRRFSESEMAEFVTRKYHWDAIAEETIRVYRQILGNTAL